MFSLNGQTALVTGGTRGIGQSMAFALAEAGADIILIQRFESKQDTQKQIEEKYKRKAYVYTADLSSARETQDIVAQILADGLRIHILLNCAGIQRRHPSQAFPTADWDEVGSQCESAALIRIEIVRSHLNYRSFRSI
jgi:2-dehydro-3-deoxy-D-gluconate 5-dehydrogenase